MSSSEHSSSDESSNIEAVEGIYSAVAPNEFGIIDKCLADLSVSVPEHSGDKFKRAEKYGHIVHHSSGACILAEGTKIADGQYLAADGSHIFHVSPDLSVSDVTEIDSSLLNSSRTEFVSDLESVLAQYTAEYYKRGKFCIVNLAGRPLQILFSAAVVNQDSSYTGQWFSVYTFSDDLTKITPIVLPYVHLFESGNVHLRGIYPAKAKEQSLSEASATAVLAFIKKFEVDYIKNVQDLWESLNEKVLKTFRRKLPVFKKKIDWTSIASLRMRIPHK
ncbi:hypothetical protein GEMRC1_011721 [Eukaryota sp. GEM-RC1]